MTDVLQHAHDIVFKRVEDQWPTITAPTALDSPRTSATTAFFKLDSRNMERAAPVDIVLPTQVRKNVDKNLKLKHQRMMMGSIMEHAKTNVSGKKKSSATQNNHRMLISAPAGRRRARSGSNGAQSSLQNRFASRRSYIPMAQETPAMREVRIERHRKKIFAQKHQQAEQDALDKLQRSHKHHTNTSHIQQVHRRNRTNGEINSKDNVQKNKAGKYSATELASTRNVESDSGNRQMQVLTSMMKRVADSAKFFADENIARSVMTEVDQDEMSSLRRGFDLNPDGLTLAQFIELMMGFVPIDVDEEQEIQAMHKHHHHHVHHNHHHQHHTDDGQVVHVPGKARLALARNLCELFEQIDINGDGSLQWDEFTSYCVSQGLATDKKASDYIKRYKLLRSHLAYREGVGVIDHMTGFILQGQEFDLSKASIMQMARKKQRRGGSTSIPQSGGSSSSSGSEGDGQKKENVSGMTLVTCDRNAIHKGTFSIRDPTSGKLLKRCGEGVHKSAVLAVCYIPCMEYIVTSSSDLTLGFWDSHKHDLRQLMPVNEEMTCLHWVDAADAGLRIADSTTNGTSAGFSAAVSATAGEKGGKGGKGRGRKSSVIARIDAGLRVGTLYTGGVTGSVIGWDVAQMYKEASLVGHTDSVTSFVSIPSIQLLVTSSMDTTVRIWNLRSNVPLKVLRGHYRGVSSVSFSNHQRVLCSCGFDHDILVWNPYVETRPSGKLRGHSCSVLSVTCVEGTYEAVSVDIEGNLRVWDLRTLTCVQTLASHEAAGEDSHLYGHIHNPNTPNPDMFKDVASKTGGDCLSWCYVHHPEGNRIMVATERHLRVYAYDEVEDPRVADAHVSNVVVFNPLTATFLTAGGRQCKTWDAVSGKLLKTFGNLIEEEKVEITALCYDDQYRQFLLGDTMGRVRMYQCSNGQLLRDLVSHTDGGEVVSILFNQVTDCIYSSSSRGQLIVQEDDGEGTEDQDQNDSGDDEETAGEEGGGGGATVSPVTTSIDGDAAGSTDINGKGGDATSGRQAGELFRRTRHNIVNLFLRKVVPRCEVTALVQAPMLGLLGWGGTDGDVVIVDAVTGYTEGMCIRENTGEAGACRPVVTALSFLEPYPLLAVAYSDGSIHVWSVRPFYVRQCPLMVFYNYKDPQVHVSSALAASAPWISKNESLAKSLGETVEVLKLCWDSAGQCLLAGDTDGSVLKWNLRYMLLKLRMQEFQPAGPDGEDEGSSESNPRKLGDILHPDLKRTTMSAREQLEEALAATPRVFKDSMPPPKEEESQTNSELAGLAWLGKIQRKNLLGKFAGKFSSKGDDQEETKTSKRDVVASSIRSRSGSVTAASTFLTQVPGSGTGGSGRGNIGDVDSGRRKTMSSLLAPEINISHPMEEPAKEELAHNFLQNLLSGNVVSAGASKPESEQRERGGIQTAASRRAYAFRSYAQLSKSKSKLVYGKVLSGDAAQLVDAKTCHHDAICHLHIMKGVRAYLSSGQDRAVVIRSLDAVGGTLDNDGDDDDEEENIDNEEDVLGRLWQGFPDPKWHLGPLVTQQIEKNLEYELKRAGAILRYMDDRDAKLQKMKETFFSGRRRDPSVVVGVGKEMMAKAKRKDTMAMMLGTKVKEIKRGVTFQLNKTSTTNGNESDDSEDSDDDSNEFDNSSHLSTSSSDSDGESSVSSYASSIAVTSINVKEDTIDVERTYQALYPNSSTMKREQKALKASAGRFLLFLLFLFLLFFFFSFPSTNFSFVVLSISISGAALL